VLTPMVVDKSRPFPLILNKSLNIAILLRGNEDVEPVFATVQVPSVLDRFILLPCENDKKRIYPT
jgi:Polyphosphate kinase